MTPEEREALARAIARARGAVQVTHYDRHIAGQLAEAGYQAPAPRVVEDPEFVMPFTDEEWADATGEER